MRLASRLSLRLRQQKGASSVQAQYLFIVRLWLEPDGNLPVWRGSVEHTPSGQRTYFQSLEGLCQFISLRLEQPGLATQTTHT